MGYKQTAPDGWWPWRSWVTNWLQQLHTDVQRLLRQTGIPPTPGVAPPSGTAFDPLALGRNGTVYEGFLAANLGASASDGSSPGTATLNLYAMVSGTWGNTGNTLTVTNRSPHLWLPSGYPLQCVSINGEARPTIQYSPMFKASLTSSLSSGGSATASLSGTTITVFPGLELGTTTLASGKGVWVVFVGGTFKVVEAEC